MGNGEPFSRCGQGGGLYEKLYKVDSRVPPFGRNKPIGNRANCFMVRFDVHKQQMRLAGVVYGAESDAGIAFGFVKVRNPESAEHFKAAGNYRF